MSLMLNKLQLAASVFRSNVASRVIPVKFSYGTVAKENNSVEDTRFKKDRSIIIPVETSIRYLKSRAYRQTYGSDPVWKHYTRNFKGQIPPKKTRKTCIRSNVVTTGNPCPICRDEYLVLDYRNVDLLKQFLCEHSGQILHYNYTNLCQRTYQDLCVAIMKSKEYGLLTYDVPIRYYDYSEWRN